MVFQLRAMHRPGRLVAWVVVDVPARAAEVFADQGLASRTGGKPAKAGRAAGHPGEAELVVQLPVPVGRKLGQAAESFLAIAQAGLGGQPSGDIPAGDQDMGDGATGILQRNLAHVNADGTAVFCRHQLVGQLLHDACCNQLQVGGVHAVCVLIRPEIVGRAAHRLFAGHPVQSLGGLVPAHNPEPVPHGFQLQGNRQVVNHFIEETRGLPLGFFRALDRADVMHRPPITEEVVLLVENGDATDRQVVRQVVAELAHVFEIAKRLMGVQHGAVYRPGSAEGNCTGQLPTALADVAVPFNIELDGRLLAGKPDEAMLCILLPVPVRGYRGQVAQSLRAAPEQVGLALLFGKLKLQTVLVGGQFGQAGLQARVGFQQVLFTAHGWSPLPTAAQDEPDRPADEAGRDCWCMRYLISRWKCRECQA